jgi:hypothetical protein
MMPGEDYMMSAPPSITTTTTVAPATTLSIETLILPNNDAFSSSGYTASTVETISPTFTLPDNFQMTISITTGATVSSQGIALLGNDGVSTTGTGGLFLMIGSTNNFYVAIHCNCSWPKHNYIISDVEAKPNKNYHIIFRYNGTHALLVVNGIINGPFAKSFTHPKNINKIRIGSFTQSEVPFNFGMNTGYIHFIKVENATKLEIETIQSSSKNWCDTLSRSGNYNITKDCELPYGMPCKVGTAPL